MRRYILFSGILALATLSCSEDKGSYNYKEINEVVISGLDAEYTTLYKSDTLKITPQLNFTQETTDRYEYIWEVGKVNFSSTAPIAVIGRERDLNYFVELEPGDYALYMGVTDKETGVRWNSRSKVTLHVRTPLARGFLVIGEDEEGYADVDMIAMPTDTVVIRGLLRNNGLPDLKEPREIVFTSEYYSATSANNRFVELWVLTGDGAFYLDLTTLKGNPQNNFRKWLFTTFNIPADLHPVHLLPKTSYYPHGWMLTPRYMLCDGYVFPFPISTWGYRDPFNRYSTSTQTLFKVFPYVFMSIYTTESSSGTIYYDMDNHCFAFAASYSSCQRMTDTPTDPFPWNQPAGREPVYGENTLDRGIATRGASAALMKDTGDEWYIYRFSVAGNNGSKNLTSPAKLGIDTLKLADHPHLQEAKLFAFASTRTLMFYAVGSTLYAYDYNAKRLYQMPFQDEITMLEFDKLCNQSGNDLYVATYNPVTKGRLQKYVVGPDPNTLDLVADERCNWDGLVKIVDMDWRNTTRTYPDHPF
jgi:hypothetical protein